MKIPEEIISLIPKNVHFRNYVDLLEIYNIDGEKVLKLVVVKFRNKYTLYYHGNEVHSSKLLKEVLLVAFELIKNNFSSHSH